MKWFRIKLNDKDLRNSLDRKIIAEFVSLFVSSGSPDDLVLYADSYNEFTPYEFVYYISSPIELAPKVRSKFNSFFIQAIETPEFKNITKLIGK